MEIITLSKGIILGFILAMSVGPIALLCISNTIERGPKFGLSVGMGAATADGIYGCVAALGITMLINLMDQYEFILKGIGGVFLIYLGWKIISTPFKPKAKEISRKALLKTYISIVGLTLINPMTIAVYMGAFAGIGLSATSETLLSGISLGIGATIGSALWHSILVAGSHYLRTHLKRKHLKALTKCSGLILSGFGVLSLISLASLAT